MTSSISPTGDAELKAIAEATASHVETGEPEFHEPDAYDFEKLARLRAEGRVVRFNIGDTVRVRVLDRGGPFEGESGKVLETQRVYAVGFRCLVALEGRLASWFHEDCLELERTTQ